MVTVEQLREELHREIDPVRADTREVRGDLSKVKDDVTALKIGMAEIGVKVDQIPKDEALSTLVVRETDAMKGKLIVWIVGTGIAVAGILKFVPTPGGG